MYHQTSTYSNITPVYTVKKKESKRQGIGKIKKRIEGHTEKLDNIQRVLNDLNNKL